MKASPAWATCTVYPRVLDALPTREFIASSIGTVREVVSCRLSRLSDSGHLRIDGSRLLLESIQAPALGCGDKSQWKAGCMELSADGRRFP